ncbi:MAG: DEAD/DEAH box helicase [Fimbriimonadaceae bacterium]|jgi:ATP-dependent RNA helicase RhlE|nr:DEAD/DEAH box helicase [Fimbriimonadaceae bacterium]
MNVPGSSEFDPALFMSVATPPSTFENLGLPKAVLALVTQVGFHHPTPIQAEAIPLALRGNDLIGVAQTGTGKTLAFALPMISNLANGEVGLVLAPTRELAQQIEVTFRKLGVSTALLIGGAAMGPQLGQLRRRPRVIIATPGRLMDHLSQNNVSLDWVGVAVLDEADRMLDMGFVPDIRKILAKTPAGRQTLLFSATFAGEVERLSQEFLQEPVKVEISRQGTAAELVEQEILIVAHEEKQEVLGDLLDDHDGSVLVFTRTRWGAKKLAKRIHSIGHSVAELHSDRTQAQRTAALNGFRTGNVRVLVATDIAARGIDVKEIGLVVNFDVPEHAEDYVHRIGRTGRAGKSGKAITFACPDQRKDVRQIESLIKAELPVSAHSRASLAESPAPRPKGGGKLRFRKRR